MTAIITKPGVYDLPQADYLADPVPEGSLSCSGAKLLLPPSCPAFFNEQRKNPPPSTGAMNLGSAAHREVLGRGWPLAVYDGDDWRKRDAQDFKRGAEVRGEVPVLAREYEQVQVMAAAVRAHPDASLLLAAEEVWAEQSFFWQDEEFGIWRRARFDAVRLHGRVIVTDYKTAASADPGEFAKAAGRYRYHMQDCWYRDAVTRVLGDADPVFVFVVQAKDPPYPVIIYELGPVSREAGAARNAAACRLFARCQRSGEWPGYLPPEGRPLMEIEVPRWAL